MKKISQLLASHTPSSDEMDALVSRIEGVLNQLKGTNAVYTRWDTEVRSLKADVTVSGGVAPQDKIPIKDGKVDPTTWNPKPEEEKRRLFGILDAAFMDLRCVNQDRLACGKTWFGWLSVLFGVIVGLYLFLHSGWWGSRLSPSKTTAIWEQVRKIELRLGEIKAGKAEGNVSDVKSALNDLTKLLGELEPQTGESLHLPFETSRLIGTVSAEIALNDPTVHQTYQELVKKLKADLESFSTAYFWITAPGRWFEIAWWAEIGCLVGLLFYIAGLRSQGLFKPEEGAMFVAECLIAPIAVTVVFFLFAFTDITSFVPSEASLTVNLGVAFILGFAIRRTMGLLDHIKKRFFPEPSPSGSNPGG